MIDYWVIIKNVRDSQNAFILWLKSRYLETDMFGLSKMLHSAVANPLT